MAVHRGICRQEEHGDVFLLYPAIAQLVLGVFRACVLQRPWGCLGADSVNQESGARRRQKVELCLGQGSRSGTYLQYASSSPWVFGEACCFAPPWLQNLGLKILTTAERKQAWMHSRKWASLLEILRVLVILSSIDKDLQGSVAGMADRLLLLWVTYTRATAMDQDQREGKKQILRAQSI